MKLNQPVFYIALSLFLSPFMIRAQGIDIPVTSKTKLNFSGMLQSQFNYSLDDGRRCERLVVPFILSIVFLIIWMGLGGLWWKVIGLY